MTQQEIDDLWRKHGDSTSCISYEMTHDGFIDAVQEATAQARREALDGLRKELNTLKWIGADEGWDMAIVAVLEHLGALIEQEPK